MEQLQAHENHPWSDEVKSPFDIKVRNYLLNNPHPLECRRWWEKAFMIPSIALLYFSSKYRLRQSFKLKDHNLFPDSQCMAAAEPLFELDKDGKCILEDPTKLTIFGIPFGKLIGLFNISPKNLTTLSMHIKITKLLITYRTSKLITILWGNSFNLFNQFNRALVLNKCTEYVKLLTSEESFDSEMQAI